MFSIDFKEYQVPLQLKGYISQFFSMQTMAEAPAMSEANLILPDCTSGLMVIEQGSILRTDHKGHQQRLSGLYLFGQKSKAISYDFDSPNLKCYGLKLNASALKSLTGVDQAELADQSLPLELLLSDFPLDQLLETEGIIAKQQILQTYIQGLLHPRVDDKTLLCLQILEYIHQQPVGQISELRDYFNLSYKYLERLFRAYVGLGPKAYLRLLRFNRVIADYNLRSGCSLHHIALDHGFYDQMHLIKEMKHFTSQTPSQFFARKTCDLEERHRDFIVQQHACHV